MIVKLSIHSAGRIIGNIDDEYDDDG